MANENRTLTDRNLQTRSDAKKGAPPPALDPPTFTLSDTAATIPGEPDPTVVQPAAGDRVAGYTLVRLIGQGGMGLVWEAMEVELNRRVAVKLMRSGLAASSGARERFLREARAQAAVAHPHVVPLFLVSEHAGTPFFVMPLLHGETLAERLTRGPLPIPEVLRIGREVAEGLAAAHAVGLIHRDVKPGNVWLNGATATVLLLDFGVARVLHDHPEAVRLTNTGAMIGTPAYMAPEQAAGEAVDARADLFALGIVLYEMVTGGHPFRGDTMFATLTALANRTPASPSAVRGDIPTPLVELIDRLLTKKPAGRWPGTADEVARLLGQLATDAAAVVLPQRTEPQPVPPVPTRGRSRWLLLLLFLVVVPLGFGGWWLLRPTAANTAPTEPLRVPTPEERLVALTARLREQPLAHTHEDETTNGFLKNKRRNVYRFAGESAVPTLSDVTDGRATIRVPYSGGYERKSFEYGFLVAPETQTVRGAVVVSVAADAGGVRVTGFTHTETGGDVTDAGHDAQKCARLAVEELVNRVTDGQ